ncbi:hypothetical protein GCM10012275_49050 [Longimycelium tulufanense]|uniref:Uncharacterized protein n=1 Tax=Longimycelium tulufanense TaxID=907463 RepID=A0A8J3CFT1_9PSEU|nr:hypothetical protein GCM10012275_49050 [Longimycelium tulufanense]
MDYRDELLRADAYVLGFLRSKVNSALERCRQEPLGDADREFVAKQLAAAAEVLALPLEEHPAWVKARRAAVKALRTRSVR